MGQSDQLDACEKPPDPNSGSGDVDLLRGGLDYLFEDELEDRVSPHLSFLAAILFFSVGNFMVAPLTKGIDPDSVYAFLIFGWLGVIAAQMTLHSVLVCLWDSPFLHRFGWGMLAGFLPTSGLLFGILTVAIHDEWSVGNVRELVSFFVCVPLFLVAVQLPFWGLRFCFRCRMARSIHDDEEKTREVWQIQDLMKATAVVAIVFSLVRMANPPSFEGNNFYWIVLSCALFAFLMSLFNAAPTVLGVLRGGRFFAFMIAITLLNVITYVAILIGGTFMNGSPPPDAAYWYIGYIVVGFWVSLIMGLMILKAFGFQILFGREQPKIRRGVA